MSNRHIKRVLSVFLSFLMILSVFAAAMPMLAGAVISQSTPASADVHFYVPECLYLYPSTAGTANFQFYLNSYPNASSTVLSGAETAGKVYFYCANAKSGTLTWSSTAALTISGIGLSSSSNTFSGSFTGSAANVNGAVITWVYTYVDASGSTRTVTAYTYIYKPNTMPSGVALSTRKRNTNYAYNSYVAMLWGFHSNGAGNASAKDLLMSYNTLTSNGSSQPTSSHINNSGSGTFQYSGENKDNPTTHFSGAAINADISRFSDLNQLPGFNIGFATCDLENSKSVKYNISTQNSAGTTLSTQINSSYSNHTVLASYATNMKAQGAINSIAAGTSGAYRIYTRAEASGKSSLYGDSKGTGYINFSVINNNKSSVRSAYIAALKESYNMQSAKYTAATWNNYQTALKNAAIALGDPTYTYASLAAQISALSTAKKCSCREHSHS